MTPQPETGQSVMAPSVSGGLSNQDLQSRASTILEDAQYRAFYAQANQNPFELWLKKVWKWVTDFFKFDPPENKAQPDDALMQSVLTIGLKVILIGLLVLVIIGLAWWAWSWWINRRRRQSGIALPGLSETDRHEAQKSLHEQACLSLAQHDYRSAIHYLFLAAVKRVIDERYFQASDWMTSRELLTYSQFDRFESGITLNHLFRQMLTTDEPRWFGHQSSTLADFEQVQAWYDEFNGLIHQPLIGLSGASARA